MRSIFVPSESTERGISALPIKRGKYNQHHLCPSEQKDDLIIKQHLLHETNICLLILQPSHKGMRLRFRLASLDS
jgi:hypothetical protein